MKNGRPFAPRQRRAMIGRMRELAALSVKPRLIAGEQLHAEGESDVGREMHAELAKTEEHEIKRHGDGMSWPLAYGGFARSGHWEFKEAIFPKPGTQEFKAKLDRFLAAEISGDDVSGALARSIQTYLRALRERGDLNFDGHLNGLEKPRLLVNPEGSK
jgi:hypothetical protein